LLYLISALALPGLNFFALVIALVAVLVGFRYRLGAMIGLARRARWLFLLLGVGYAYGLPGPAVWPPLGDYGPSLPGLHAGVMQMLRLSLLLSLLDALVVGMGQARMMVGLHGLFGGLRWLGFPAERTTVRLGLTLQAMEANSMKLKDLTALLSSTGHDPAASDRFSLRREPWRALDTALVFGAAIGLIGTWFA
jgi:hypothetical protein